VKHSPLPARPIVITIDGPAGTGKSSVAAELAARLGLEFLDTGAMYRAAALLSIEREISPHDGSALAGAVRSAGLRFLWGSARPRLMLDGRDVSERIRDMDVSRVVSIVAGCPTLRQLMVEEQRRIAREHPRLVTEGRDQGSIVFPDAIVRFYLDARPEVRAARRQAQLEALGSAVDEQLVKADISRRDQLDSTRSEGPLRRPEGALLLDTTDLTLADVVDRLEALVREHVGESDPLPVGAGSGERSAR